MYYNIFKNIKKKQILLNYIHKDDKTIENTYETFIKYDKLYNTIKNIFLNQTDITQIKQKLETNIITSIKEMENNAEVSSPFNLLDIICEKNKDYFTKNYKFLDYSCGKGNIIVTIFINLYNELSKTNTAYDSCKLILDNYIYFGDLTVLNVFVTISILHNLCLFYCNKEYYFDYNFYIGDSFNLNLKQTFDINYIDVVFVNPPFQDKTKNKTQHKIWVKFTEKTFKDWLSTNGILIQISPSSYGSPSNKVLKFFHTYYVKYLFLNQEQYFPKVGSSFSWYVIEKCINDKKTILNNDKKLLINTNIVYMPNDLSDISLNIHKKVMFDTTEKLDVKYDYTTCHNNILKKCKEKGIFSSISKTKTDKHIYPLFHTNAQIWYSSIKQDFLNKKKVLWTRSGYTKPFYDNGVYGITDLSYYVLVKTDKEGENLSYNLNLKLFKYIFDTAKWSGFGTDKVFYLLPTIKNKKYDDKSLYNCFKLTKDEIKYIENFNN
jgi:adenine-specific DNA-methyltransferase